MQIYSFTCDASDSGKRIDVYLTENIEPLSRSAAAALIDGGSAVVNGLSCKKNKVLAAGDVVDVTVPDAQSYDVEPENIPLDVVYEDDCLLVVNKPQGMVVHPAPGNQSGTLVNALLWHCRGSLSGINGVERPGIVHRLDKGTSGLLIVAKNDAAHASLASQIALHSFDRKYMAVVRGKFDPPDGTIDLPIGRHPVDRQKMAVVPNGRRALTDYRTLAAYSAFGASYSHMELTLFTGRTHQIRVHCAYYGHPVLGDSKYGIPDRTFSFLDAQCLHAYFIAFTHPLTGERLSFSAPLPNYFSNVLDMLNRAN